MFFRPWDLQSLVHYCTNPGEYGHTSRYGHPAGAPAPDDGDDPDPGVPPVEEPPDPSRRIVIEGNKAWAAATEVRRRWLVTLFARSTVPCELAQFVARQLVTPQEVAASYDNPVAETGPSQPDPDTPEAGEDGVS